MKITKLRALGFAALLMGLALVGYPLARAASPIQLGGSIFPLTLISIPDLNPTDAFNQMEQLVNAQVMPASASTTPFSTTYNSNPLVEQTVQNIPVASVNASATGGYNFVAGASGVTIYPGLPVVMASGTAATATNLTILCSPSGTAIATYPIANLVTNQPVIPVSGGGTANPTTGKALGVGCASGDSIDASTGGSAMTTTTNIFINLPYTTQVAR